MAQYSTGDTSQSATKPRVAVGGPQFVGGSIDSETGNYVAATQVDADKSRDPMGAFASAKPEVPTPQTPTTRLGDVSVSAAPSPSGVQLPNLLAPMAGTAVGGVTPTGTSTTATPTATPAAATPPPAAPAPAVTTTPAPVAPLAPAPTAAAPTNAPPNAVTDPDGYQQWFMGNFKKAEAGDAAAAAAITGHQGFTGFQAANNPRNGLMDDWFGVD